MAQLPRYKAFCSVAAQAAVMTSGSVAYAQTTGVSDLLMDDIVVTARKRDENLQSTPISITAFSGESLEARGVTSIGGIEAFTPNLVYQNIPGANGSTSAAAIYIRGIGQREYLPTVEPGVGLYVDGVYIARSVGALLDLLDVERIEVLRGPQGTLFGRNTIGGAVSITTAKPSEELAFKGNVLYGTDNRFELTASGNVPLSDTLFGKISVGYFRQDGYITRTFDGQDLGDKNSATGRAALRWLATDSVTIDLAFDGTRTRQNGAAMVLRDISYDSRIFNPARRPLAPPTFPLSPGASISPFGGTPAGFPLAFDPVTNQPVLIQGGFGGTAAFPGALPPGVDPGTLLYRVTPPGVDPSSVGDAPLDNFALLHNYTATLLGGQDCLSGFFEPFDPAGNPANPACYNRQYVTEGQRINFGTFPSFSNDDIWGGNLNIEWEGDGLTVRSITAYRELKSRYARDDDMSPLQISQFSGTLDQEQFSQEINLLGSSFSDRLKWIVGGFYILETAVTTERPEFPPVTVFTGGDVKNTSTALFGQATLDVTERLAVTAGVRWTRDIKRFTPNQFVAEDRTGGVFPVGTRTLPMIEAKVTASVVNPMINVSYDWTGGLITYATFSQGFKSGGFAQRVFPPLPTVPSFEPEKVNAYELGVKYESPGRTLRINAATFLTDYQNLQVNVFTGIAPVIQNAADATVKGFELEAAVSPGAGFFIEGSLAHLDTGYDRIGTGATEISIGNRFEYVPAWTASAAISKDLETENAGTFTPRLEWNFRGKVFTDVRNLEQLAQGSYHLVNANLTWQHPGGVFGATAGVTNLTKQDFISASFFSPDVGPQSVLPNRGRQWFISLRASY